MADAYAELFGGIGFGRATLRGGGREGSVNLCKHPLLRQVPIRVTVVNKLMGFQQRLSQISHADGQVGADGHLAKEFRNLILIFNCPIPIFSCCAQSLGEVFRGVREVK